MCCWRSVSYGSLFTDVWRANKTKKNKRQAFFLFFFFFSEEVDEKGFLFFISMYSQLSVWCILSILWRQTSRSSETRVGPPFHRGRWNQREIYFILFSILVSFLSPPPPPIFFTFQKRTGGWYRRCIYWLIKELVTGVVTLYNSPLYTCFLSRIHRKREWMSLDVLSTCSSGCVSFED